MKMRILQAGIAAGVLAVHVGAVAAQPVIEVYKSATCGCCTAWVEHLEEAGFTVKATNVQSPADYRQKFGIPAELGSCHTGYVQGYALEGHVPAADIKRLLAEKPKAKGLAVPGMPLGSPGMEVPGEPADAFDVILVQGNGKHTVYQHHKGKPVIVQARAGDQDGAHQASGQESAAMSDAEVRKVNKDTQKITLRHGELKNLDMPPMTMVFRVADPAMLDKVKAGDKVRFVADKVDGQFTIMKIEVQQ